MKRWTFLLVIAASGMGCDRTGATSPAATAPVAKPLPQRCTVCNGTGSITQSSSAPLPAKITQCTTEDTGFLGLGDDKIAIVEVENNGDVEGTFTLKAFGLYPGGGRILNGSGQAFVAPHGRGSKRIEFTPQAGIQKIECDVESPTVVQHNTVICPACSGKGMTGG